MADTLGLIVGLVAVSIFVLTIVYKLVAFACDIYRDATERRARRRESEKLRQRVWYGEEVK